MANPVHLAFLFAACAVAPFVRAQGADANSGPMAGTGGVLFVASQPDQMLLKDPGYASTFPTERAPLGDAPDFRAQSMLYSHMPPPAGLLAIDAFSIGQDWIVANAIGECLVPSGRWAVLLFSVTPLTNGAGGGVVQREATFAADGADGDLFCYEFTGTLAGGFLADKVTRALDSSDIDIQPAVGTGDMTGFDYFAATYAHPDFLERPPSGPTAYFSVTNGSAGNVPPEWVGYQLAHRNGATVFKTTWRPGTPGSWSRPTVYLTRDNLQLALGVDVDALAVDTIHHDSDYVLFSTANPGPISPRIQFHNRGTGVVATYRYQGGVPVDSKLGLGNGDVDALCALDPGAADIFEPLHGATVQIQSGWPPSGTSYGPVDQSTFRLPGSPFLHGFGASNDLTAAHHWYVRLPDAPGGPQWNGPYVVPRQPGWKGAPSFFAWPMNPALAKQRVQIGLVEVPTVGPAISSPVVGVTEWGERGALVTAPTLFATSEGSSSVNIWRNTPNRVQCLYDTTHFTSQGVVTPILIDELEWRQAGVAVGGQQVAYPSVDVYLGYAQTDYLSPSTTFQANRGTFVQVHSGPVDVQPACRTIPNGYTIDLVLATPFLYDPTLGQDLLVEIVITWPPSPAVSSAMSTSFDAAVHAANTVRSLGTTSASTGAISPFCPVCRFGYSVPPNAAQTTAYGNGCYSAHASFHETFGGGAFDLGGPPVRSIRFTPANGGYDIGPGSNGWFQPQSAGLGLGDDTTIATPLPQSFAWPTGSTSWLTICSNGFVTLNGTSTNTSYEPSAAALLAGEPRFCPCWTDLVPQPGADVHFDAVFGGGQWTAYVTWPGVAPYPIGGGGTANVQLVLELGTGAVEYRYGVCWLPSASLVGWSPGGGALDPGPRDLDDPVFSTRTDHAALGLDAAPRALVGTSVLYTVSNIDPSALLTLHLMSFGDVDYGFELGVIGMPGCRLYVTLPVAVTYALFGSPTASMWYSIPPSPSLVGIQIDSQAAAFVPGINPFGAVTSNGLVVRVGNL